MKKTLVWMLSLMLVLCSAAFAEEAAVTPDENTFFAEDKWFPTGKLEMNTATEYDLDGDGTMETVSWKEEAVDEYDNEVVLTVEKDGAKAEYRSGMISMEGVAVYDLDGDGTFEIFITGDEMSSDYFTVALHYADGQLTKLDFANVDRGDDDTGYHDYGYGYITGLGENALYLNGSQDVLGTYFGWRAFTLKDGRFETCDDGLWHFDRDLEDADTWDWGCLTVKQEAKAMFQNEGKESEGALQVGDKLVITASDKATRAYFETQDGRQGYLEIAPNTEQGWGWLVNGVSENDVFEIVPYAD